MNRRSLLSFIAASPILAVTPAFSKPAHKEIDFSKIESDISNHLEWVGKDARGIMASFDGQIAIDMTTGCIRISS